MKKLVTILAVLFLGFLASCDDSIKPVDNPKHVTTLDVYAHVVDSCASVAINDNRLYVLDNNTKTVVYAYENIPIVFWIFVMLSFLIVGIFIGKALFES